MHEGRQQRSLSNCRRKKVETYIGVSREWQLAARPDRRRGGLPRALLSMEVQRIAQHQRVARGAVPVIG